MDTRGAIRSIFGTRRALIGVIHGARCRARRGAATPWTPGAGMMIAGKGEAR